MIKLILARALNNVIGANGKMPWHLPEDLQLFKAKTEGHVVLMGRKTWESLPNTFKPLPDRVNVVLAKQGVQAMLEETYHPHEVISVADYTSEAAEGVLQSLQQKYPGKDIWVIGGRQTYELFLPFVEEIHETVVALTPEGDVQGIDPATLSDFYKTVGPGATPNWTMAANGMNFRVNLYMRKPAHLAAPGAKPWDA